MNRELATQSQLFNFEGNDFTVILINNEPHWIAKEICDYLELSNPSVSLKNLKDGTQKKYIDGEILRMLKKDTKLQIDKRIVRLNLLTKLGLHQIISNTRKINLEKKIKLYKSLTGEDFDNSVTRSFLESEFIPKLQKSLIPFHIKGIKQYKILGYHVDYYIPKLNLAVEYDENGHKNYTYEQQEGRQAEIEKELGCKFIRVKEKNTDEYNIGLVIKNIIKTRGMVL